jgi:hypothetical protein
MVARYTPEKFWSNATWQGECLVWNKDLHKDGYGQLTYHRKYYLSHRLSWILTFGDIPKGLYVLHKCDNPPCINPNHLYLGTQQDNVNDMYSKHRDNNLFGSKHGMALLTEDQVREILKLYDTGTIQIKQLAERYGISKTGIYHIVHRENWKHLETK